MTTDAPSHGTPFLAFQSANRLLRLSRSPGLATTSSPAVWVWLFTSPVSQSRITYEGIWKHPDDFVGVVLTYYD